MIGGGERLTEAEPVRSHAFLPQKASGQPGTQLPTAAPPCEHCSPVAVYSPVLPNLAHILVGEEPEGLGGGGYSRPTS